MSAGLRVVIASYGAAQFRALHEAVTGAGHAPAAYLLSRSMRSGGESSPYILEATKKLLDELPAGMDLLLPGGTSRLAELLAAYSPDILLVFGLNWWLPREVREVPRLGALNIHPSALPKHRGPSPLIWAVRNAEEFLGLTVHRMTGRIDAGPVLAQVVDIPLPKWVTRDQAWDLQAAALPGLLDVALTRAASGDPGIPQDEDAVTVASAPPESWYTVTWQDSRREVYDQLRLMRYIYSERASVTVNGREARFSRASLTDDGSTRVECPDGPLWVTLESAQSGESA